MNLVSLKFYNWKTMSQLASEDFTDLTPEDQYPYFISAWSLSQWKSNWRCISLTCTIFSCIIILIYLPSLQLPVQKKEVIPYNQNDCLSWTLIFLSVILYSIYLIECSYATDHLIIGSDNILTISKIRDKIERMKNSDPVIWWKATCYHFVRRKRRMAQYNRRGNYMVSTSVFQERINSFTSNSSFDYSYSGVSDISNNLILDGTSKSIIKFSFSKGFAFANMISAIDFEEQRSMYFREHRRFDDFMDTHEGMDLLDSLTFDEEIFVLNNDYEIIPWFANSFYYWLYSCFLLSWPFRLLQWYNTAHVQFKITKLFGTNYNSPTDQRQNFTLVHFCDNSSLIDSDISIQDRLNLNTQSENGVEEINNSLIPSYSEALLLLNEPQILNEGGRFSGENSSNNCSPANTNRRSCTPYKRKFISYAEIETYKRDDLPTYEEALNFPLIERSNHPTFSISSFNKRINTDSHNINNDNCRRPLIHSPSLQNRTRLINSDNCRTVLSIETSL